MSPAKPRMTRGRLAILRALHERTEKTGETWHALSDLGSPGRMYRKVDALFRMGCVKRHQGAASGMVQRVRWAITQHGVEVLNDHAARAVDPERVET